MNKSGLGESLPITKEDEELVQASKDIIKKLYKPFWHVVGSAIRTKEGKIYSGVHLESDIGRTAICAEVVALGKAISEGESEFETIVAAYHKETGEINVCTPCGMCRELATDYNKDINVIILRQGQLYKCKMMDLIPEKYCRE